MIHEAEKKLIKWHKGISKIPYFSFVTEIIKQFPEANIYLVGGAVRDIILERQTKDFDFVISKVDVNDLEKFLSQKGKVNLVGKSFGVFKFVPENKEEKIEAFDIALPRTEHAGMSGGYKDFEIQSDKDLPIKDDLGRRDFTINALAYDLKNEKIIDEFGGIKDLQDKIIRAIGDPKQRFQEDYTRMMRAIRFSCQLNFEIEEKTLATIKSKADKIISISKERIYEEFIKIIMSDRAEQGIRIMQEIGLLKILIPELEKGVGMSQNKAHIYDIFEHSVRALGVGAEKKFKLEVRLAALFHDIGKPITKEGEGVDATFYNHDSAGAKITKSILRRLNFPIDITNHIVHLVRYHMFYYALDTVSDAGVRRLLNRLGPENIDDFINVRICDRLGMGRPKAKPWKLIQLERRFKEVQLDPITPKMLKINGTELMELLNIKPGPKVGLILNALLGEALEDPKKNEKEYLNKKSFELNNLPDEELKKMHPDVKFYDEERKRMLHGEK
ncbi:MAG: CCA tRNA nucleotidyltransferase [Patescibacteria group bacterium]|jgi:putative nucleotidyltransferase with HDIG domain